MCTTKKFNLDEDADKIIRMKHRENHRHLFVVIKYDITKTSKQKIDTHHIHTAAALAFKWTNEKKKYKLHRHLRQMNSNTYAYANLIHSNRHRLLFVPTKD